MQMRDGLWANVRGLVKLKREVGGLVWLLAWVHMCRGSLLLE